MMAENVKVIVRCRPMNKKERDLKCQCVVRSNECRVDIWEPNGDHQCCKTFTFDSTYGPDYTTDTIYNDICYPLVESVLEGYNATIFVYGQTGCGKSFTMEGDRDREKSGSNDKGIMSRAFEHIFEAIQVTSGVKFLVLVSYLEIYNEQIRDLLCLHSDQANLSLKDSYNDSVAVSGLSTHPVHDTAECEHFLNLGAKNRIIGTTLMNQNSSRSHCIFTISIEQIDNNESIRKGKLNLVDLAGSERQAKTGATGDRLREATKINLSLSALGNVISALVDGKSKHIPYRDSKLTRLLKDSLGGNTRTLMIACISPSSRDYVETLSTLRYANRAKNIHNKPRVNEDPKDTILRQYQEEIEHLKRLLDANHVEVDHRDGNGDVATSVNNKSIIMDSGLDMKRDALIAQYQIEMEQLQHKHDHEKHEKETIQDRMEALKLEHEQNISRLNEQIQRHEHQGGNSDPPTTCGNDEILHRIEVLKAAMIGGEKANDAELSERRRRKKLEAEARASVIAHLLAKIDMNEDRELLQNQYKDISQELNLKTDALRRYRHRVKTLEKEIIDIQGEFENERQDYLETIRKQEQNVKLWMQISEKLASTLKRDCNYSDLDSIREQAIWLEDSHKYRLPELVFPRTKLPPPGRNFDSQTAPARLHLLDEDEHSLLKKKLESTDQNDFIGNYFQPTTKRANELLKHGTHIHSGGPFVTSTNHNVQHSSKFYLDSCSIVNKWKSATFPDYLKMTSPNIRRLLTSSSETGCGGKTGDLGSANQVYRVQTLPDLVISKNIQARLLNPQRSKPAAKKHSDAEHS